MNNAQWITLVIILVGIPIIIWIVRSRRREGVVVEKFYKPSSRFMAFEYDVKIEGKEELVRTQVLMTEYGKGDLIKF